MIVRFSGQAEADLEEIGDRIAADAPSRAASFVAELRGRCASLSEFPVPFPVATRTPRGDVRKLAHGDYLLLYTVSAGVVNIIRVLHSRRDWPTLPLAR